VRAFVLTGFGKKAFVSGADVNFLAKIENAAHGEATSRDSQGAIDSVAKLGKPVVCALNGLAFGGGIELAMAATMRICAKDLMPLAGQPETNLGILPGAGGTQRLPRIVGIVKAAEMMRNARPISSKDAVAIGLVSEEVEGNLIDRAIELAKGLASGRVQAPPMPLGPLPNVPSELPAIDIGHRSKKVDTILVKAILDGARTTLDEGLLIEAKAFGEVCATQDMRIGVENFLKNGPKSKAAFVHA